MSLHVRWVLTFYPIFQSVSLIGTFGPFTFKVNIVMCEFDAAILMLAGCFVSCCSFFILFTAFYHLVRFWSGRYLFLSLFTASFRSSCKAGLVVMKSLSNCLSIKYFLSLSLMNLTLAGYEILG